MASDWTEATVGDAFDLVNGYAFKSADFIDQGVPVIKIKNVKAGEFSEYEFSYVSEDFLKNRSNKLACFGDLLISMSGNRHDGSPETWVGKVAQFRKTNNCFINQRVGALRVKKGVQMDSRFASYLLSSMPYQELFIAIATSSGGQANLSPAQILGAPMRYPTLPEQRAIAHILGTLDDKIELNRRRNQTLEAMARALFKDWFVDFGPVRAKMENQEPYLPADLWQLFPDRLDDEGKPEGWEIGTLGDVAEHPRRNIQPDSIYRHTPYIALEHMPKRCIALNDWDNAGALESNKYEFKQGEILFGKLRPYFHKVGVAPIDGVCSTDIVVITPQEEHFFGFVLCLVSGNEFVEYTNSGSTGTKMPRTSWNEMARYGLALPPVALAEAFNDVVQLWLSQIIGGIHESRTLAQLRDTLLPKLIYGELRIADAEKFIRVQS